MAEVTIPQRRDLTREDVDRRPRWMRWAEQQMETGWRLVVFHDRAEAWWERGTSRTPVSYRTACRIEQDVPAPPTPAPWVAPAAAPPPVPVPRAVLHTYTDPMSGVTMRTKTPARVVGEAMALYRTGAPMADIEAATGVHPSTIAEWVSRLGVTHRQPVKRPAEAHAARGMGLAYHDAETGRTIRVRYPPSLVGRALALFRDGHTHAEAAEIAGVPATALRNWCTRLGIRRRARRALQDLVPS